MVTSHAAPAGQVAPAGLEPVRELLNSWLIPNDSRVPADTFADYAGEQGWRGREAALVRELRDDIRRAVETGEPAGLNPWIGRLGLRPAIGSNGIGSERSVSSEHRSAPSTVSAPSTGFATSTVRGRPVTSSLPCCRRSPTAPGAGSRRARTATGSSTTTRVMAASGGASCTRAGRTAGPAAQSRRSAAIASAGGQRTRQAS